MLDLQAMAKQIADFFMKQQQQEMTDTPAPTITQPPTTQQPKKDKKKEKATEQPPQTPGVGAAAAAVAAGWKLFKAGDPGLGASGRGTDKPVNKAGKLAYEALYKKGEIHPKGSSLNADLVPKEFFPSEQVRFSFKIMFDENFPWGSDRKKVGGKIIGFFIGQGKASGGNYTKTASTFRLTWSFNGGVGPYLYPQVKNPHVKGGSGGKDISWADLDQSKEVQAVSYVAAGIHMFYPKKKENIENWDLKFKKGVWNDVEMYIKLNTPGKQDGILSLTINGVNKRLDSVRYRNDNAKIERVEISTFFGGGTKDYAPPADTRAWYADFAFSKT